MSPEPRKPDTHKQLELRPLLAELDQRLDADEPAIGCFKACLKQGAIQLENAFLAGSPVEPLVIGRARLVDEVLIRAWSHHTGQPGELSLVAVGGYGRGELHPASDIDVMVLAPESGADPWREQLEAFFTFLWDIGLEVGQSVRTVSQCDNSPSTLNACTTNKFPPNIGQFSGGLFSDFRLGATHGAVDCHTCGCCADVAR